MPGLGTPPCSQLAPSLRQACAKLAPIRDAVRGEDDNGDLDLDFGDLDADADLDELDLDLDLNDLTSTISSSSRNRGTK